MANCGRPHTPTQFWSKSLRWRHNGHDSVSNHQPHHCLLNLYSDENQRKHQSSAWRHQAITWTSVDLPQNKILWHSFQAPVLSNQISLIHGSMSWCQYYVASKLLPCQWYFGPVITYGEPVPSPSEHIGPWEKGKLFCKCMFQTDLTHWGRDKMDAISQTTFSNAFSWMKML